MSSSQGADVILVDDMIDTGTTLEHRVQLLKEAGARRVFAFASHSLFTGDCVKHIQNSGVEQVRSASHSFKPPPRCLHDVHDKWGVSLCFGCRAAHQFVVTDTVPLSKEAQKCSVIRQVSVAPLIAKAIKRMHRRQSLQDLRVYSRKSTKDRYAGQHS